MLQSNKMSQQFPLYTTLLSNLPQKDLTVVQKSGLVKKIANLDTEAHDLVFALIKCYFLEHNTTDTFAIPYNGLLAKDRIDFDLLNFPIELRQLLYKFVTIHTKKLDEDKQIQELQGNEKK